MRRRTCPPQGSAYPRARPPWDMPTRALVHKVLTGIQGRIQGADFLGLRESDDLGTSRSPIHWNHFCLKPLYFYFIFYFEFTRVEGLMLIP